MKKRKLERDNIRKKKENEELLENDRRLEKENRKTIDQTTKKKETIFKGKRNNYRKENLENKEEILKEETLEKLKENRKLDEVCILRKKLELEIDNNTGCNDKKENGQELNIQRKNQKTKVETIRNQIEKKIRKLDDKQNKPELIQNSPINKRKLDSGSKRKLQSSMKKLVQSKKQHRKYNIPNNQQSIWEFWGLNEKQKDTSGGTFDENPKL